MTDKLQLPPYYKAAILGIALMCLVVAAVGVSYFGMSSSNEAAGRAINNLVPALDELQSMDRDLYQAQMALERAALGKDAAELEAQMVVYDQNVGQTFSRFNAYQERTTGFQDQEEPVTSYLGFRALWLQAAERLRVAVISGNSGEQLRPLVDQTAAIFADMRFSLDRIAGSVMDPRLLAAREEMAARQREARGILIATVIAALVLGATITISGVVGIRRQYEQMVSQQDQREFDSRRKEFEQRIRTAFELTQSEEAALTVVGDVLEEVADSKHYSELLLADSSMAHLRRAVGAEMPEIGRGCNVLRPEDCPAVRRNARLVFPDNDAFEVCPYLRGRGENGCSASCIPINILGRPAGVLHTVGPKGELPTPEQDQALRSLASEAGDVLGMLRAFATKDLQANTDSLTGLANRRSLEATMPAIISRGVYAVAFGDLDFFKQLNDTHGHDMGDKALRLFGDALRASLRPDDLIARWGGEEFVIVLPGLVDEKAVRVVDRVRERLHDMLAMGVVPQFTVSFGMSDSRGTDSFDDVVNAADEALLGAKKEGRDRIIYAVRDENDHRLTEEIVDEKRIDSGVYRKVVA
jgi:diguanylate cyclase (GGDEF)-like protein